MKTRRSHHSYYAVYTRTHIQSPVWERTLQALKRLELLIYNDKAVIVLCKSQPGAAKPPFKIHKFPTIKLLTLKPASKNTAVMEYFGDPASVEGYIRFVREEGSVRWFQKEKDAK